jgi:caa(3)-type oxidase subunit IV
MSETHADEHHEHNYVKIWMILVVLLVISVAGPFLEIQVITLITAFGIACVKAYLVVKYFMHLTVEPKIAGMIIITALAFMGLFYFGVAPDVMEHSGQNWENVAAQEEVKRALKAIESAGGGH